MIYSTERLFVQRGFVPRLSGKKINVCHQNEFPVCNITVRKEFAIAKFHCSHIRVALNIIVCFKGLAFAAHFAIVKKPTPISLLG